MLYKTAHILRDKFPFIWDIIDKINSMLFYIRFRKKLLKINDIINISRYQLVPISGCSTTELINFFQNQPADSYDFFRPHNFDFDTLKKLQSSKAFLAFVVKDNESIVGYFFLRSFFYGDTYLGRIVDSKHRGQGIAKLMNNISTEIFVKLDLRAYQTISPDNIASLKSAEASNVLVAVKKMHNGDILYETLPK